MIVLCKVSGLVKSDSLFLLVMHFLFYFVKSVLTPSFLSSFPPVWLSDCLHLCLVIHASLVYFSCALVPFWASSSLPLMSVFCSLCSALWVLGPYVCGLPCFSVKIWWSSSAQPALSRSVTAACLCRDCSAFFPFVCCCLCLCRYLSGRSLIRVTWSACRAETGIL